MGLLPGKLYLRAGGDSLRGVEARQIKDVQGQERGPEAGDLQPATRLSAPRESGYASVGAGYTIARVDELIARMAETDSRALLLHQVNAKIQSANGDHRKQYD